jgi:glycolate oxidase iron-sulfur subunit
MRTSITNQYRDTSTGEEAERILRNCVHCGFCNATCPTYLLLGDELDGPRGRIYLIKNMLEGETPTAKTQLHLDRCLTCRNCETTCPSGVEYGRLLDIGRKLVTDQVKRSPGQQLFRFMLRKLLLSKKLFSGSLYLGQVFRPVLPRSIQQSIPLRVSPLHVWPTTQHQRKVLLVEGCVQTALQPDIDKAAAIVFDRIGIQSLRIKAAGCCGSISHHAEAESETQAYIKTNIDAWWPVIQSGSIEAITITASGCGVMLKDYAHILADDPDYADKARKISALYKDPCEIITADDIETGNFNAKHTGKPIAFHPPCTLQHGLKLDGRIEVLLTSLGYKLVSFNDKHLCCGSAGTYSITQKDLSGKLRDNKLAAIESAQPELIVTANIGCQTHLQGGTATPVKHWLELLV